MNQLSFFTPVRYDAQQNSILNYLYEGIEDYFSLSSYKACVISNRMVGGSQEVEIKYRFESRAKQVGLGALKIVSYISGVIPLIMLIAKATFRATHQFHEIPSVELLKNDIILTEPTIQKVQSVIKNVLHNQNVNGIKFYSGQPHHRIFSIDSEPNFIFKMVPHNNHEIEKRYNRMIFAKTVCRVYDLDLLVIPGARKIEVQNHIIIVEKRMEIHPEESIQEQNYHEYAANLNETIRQLTAFISKTHFSDMEWRNAPIIENSLDDSGNCKIALIDLEEMEGAEDGLFGSAFPPRKGLVACVNEEQGNIVVEEAKKHLFWNHSLGKRAETSQTWRKDELEDEAKLRDFYSTFNIQNGDEQIVIDQENLDFSDFPKSNKLKQLATALIDKINKTCAKSSSEKSVKARRHVYINTNRFGTPFAQKDHTRPDTTTSGHTYLTGEEYFDATYLGIVVKKLVALGCIHKLIKRNGHGYFLQA